MARQTAHIKIETPKRTGVYAKSKTSVSKTSKNYKKPYRGQGR